VAKNIPFLSLQINVCSAKGNDSPETWQLRGADTSSVLPSLKCRRGGRVQDFGMRELSKTKKFSRKNNNVSSKNTKKIITLFRLHGGGQKLHFSPLYFLEKGVVGGKAHL
jgi:hypothetical protein